MAITPQDFDFNQLLARSLPPGDPLIDQLRAGSLSANTSPVPRIVPPTAGIFARRSADPGPYPVAQPYTLPKPNLFGVEPPGVGEQDLPPQPPAVNYGDMTFSQLLGEDLSPAQKFTKEITKTVPDIIKNPTLTSILGKGATAAASTVFPPAAILSAAGSVASKIHERNKQAEIQRRLKTPDPSSMMPQLGIHRPDFDPITWNRRNLQQPPHALDALADVREKARKSDLRSQIGKPGWKWDIVSGPGSKYPRLHRMWNEESPSASLELNADAMETEVSRAFPGGAVTRASEEAREQARKAAGTAALGQEISTPRSLLPSLNPFVSAASIPVEAENLPYLDPSDRPTIPGDINWDAVVNTAIDAGRTTTDDAMASVDVVSDDAGGYQDQGSYLSENFEEQIW